MLYQVQIQPADRERVRFAVLSDDGSEMAQTAMDSRFWSTVVEAPTFKTGGPNGHPVFNLHFEEWLRETLHEQSVVWGFVEVKMEVAMFQPLRIKQHGERQSAVSTTIDERRYRVPRDTSFQKVTSPPTV